MAHPRRLIREEIERRLNLPGALVDLGWSFTQSMALPDTDMDTPQGYVYTDDESIEERTMQGEYRSVEVSVVLIRSGATGAGAQDALDDAAEHVERVLYEDKTQGGNAMRTAYLRTASARNSDGLKIAGSMVLTFSVTYGRSI